MAKFLVGILTTRDAEKAKRCIDSVNSNSVDIVVIVNSPDPEYLKKVEESCAGHTIIQTECNGTPGKGKNSVLQYFVDSEYDYLLPIDGDDFYTNNGVRQIVRYTNLLGDVDVMGQLDNRMSYKGEQTDWETFSANMAGGTFAAKSRSNWRMIRQFNKLTTEVFPFNRILVFSKKAAIRFRYNETIRVADDLLANLELYCDTAINYYTVKEKQWYFYDLTDGGILQSFAANDDNKENMEPFFQRIQELDFDKGTSRMVG